MKEFDEISAKDVKREFALSVNYSVKSLIGNFIIALESLCDYQTVNFNYEGFTEFKLIDSFTEKIINLIGELFTVIELKFTRNALPQFELRDNRLILSVQIAYFENNSQESIIFTYPDMLRLKYELTKALISQLLPSFEPTILLKIEDERKLGINDLVLLLASDILLVHFNQLKTVLSLASLDIQFSLATGHYYSRPTITSSETTLVVTLNSAKAYQIDSVLDSSRSFYRKQENYIVNRLWIVPLNQDSIVFSSTGNCTYFVQSPEHIINFSCSVYNAMTQDQLEVSYSLNKRILTISDLPKDLSIMIILRMNDVPAFIKYLYTTDRPLQPQEQIIIEAFDVLNKKSTITNPEGHTQIFQPSPPSIAVQLPFAEPLVKLQESIKSVSDKVTCRSYRISEESYWIELSVSQLSIRDIKVFDSFTNRALAVAPSSKEHTPVPHPIYYYYEGKRKRVEIPFINSYLSISSAQVIINYHETYLSTENSDGKKPKTQVKRKKRNFLNKLFDVPISAPKSLENLSHSIAASLRNDTLLVFNFSEAPVSLEANSTVLFKHKCLRSVTVTPTLLQNAQGNYSLQWSPTVKGFYSLYINKRLIQQSMKIYIRASISTNNSELIVPSSIFQLEPAFIVAQLKDEYLNEISKSDYDPQNSGDSSIELSTGVLMKFSIVNIETGQDYNFTLAPNREHPQLNVTIPSQSQIEISCTINGAHIMNSPLTVTVQPSKFETRRKIFYNRTAKLPHSKSYQSITVDRYEFIPSLMENAPDNLSYLRKRLDVKWKGEAGGGRGPTTEFYDKIGKEITNPENILFTKCHSGYKPSSLASKFGNYLYGFRVAGAYVANALIHKKLIGVSFSHSVLELFLGNELKAEALIEDDPELYASISQLLSYSQSDLETADLNFTANRADYKVVELTQDGGNTRVTQENVTDYVARLLHWNVFQEIEQEMKCLQEGFHAVLPVTYVSMFNSQELQLLFSGSTTVTLAYIKKRARYESYNSSSKVVQWLWTWLESSSEEIVKGFLRFSTGSSSIPYKSSWHIVIGKNTNDNMMPEASTCFSTIRIPVYLNYEKLAKYMNYAILEGNEGYAFA